MAIEKKKGIKSCREQSHTLRFVSCVICVFLICVKRDKPPHLIAIEIRKKNNKVNSTKSDFSCRRWKRETRKVNKIIKQRGRHLSLSFPLWAGHRNKFLISCSCLCAFLGFLFLSLSHSLSPSIIIIFPFP